MIRNLNALKRAARLLHRWVGLTVGLVFVGYGLTGSYIVFMDEIEAWMDPSMKRSIAATPHVSLGALAQANDLPEGALRVRIPEDPTRNVEFLFNREQHTRYTAYIDPATQEQVGTRLWANSLSGFLYRFHHDLFLGGPGKTVTAIQASFVLSMLLVGLWLWWPRRGERARALTAKPLSHARGTLRTHLELHKLAGIYASLLLVMAVSTGIFIARSDWFITRPALPPLPPSAISYAAIDRAFVNAGLQPRGSTVRIRAESVTVFHHTGTAYLLDAEAGLFVPRPGAKGSDIVYDTLRDIHAGRYFGSYGAVITCIVGLLPLMFYITGLTIYWKKRGHRRAAQAAKLQQAEMVAQNARADGHQANPAK